MESAHLWKLHYPSQFRWLDISWKRRILVEGQMGACSFVVSEIRLQHAMQAGFVQNDHVVQALAANRSDQPFDIGIGMSVQLRRMAMLKFDVSE